MKKILTKKDKDYLKVAAGVPLAYGSLAFVGGSLPGTMGTTMTSALGGSVGMVGVVSKVGMLGFGYNQIRKMRFDKQLKQLKGGNKKSW